jgi:SAM-dependent methyltransferase
MSYSNRDMDKMWRWAVKSDTLNYEKQMGRLALLKDHRIVSGLLAGATGRILDLPCGTGRFLTWLEGQPDRFQPIGADYSPTMLSTAALRVQAPLLRADGFHLAIASESFDAVLCLRLVFHYTAPRGLLRECWRVLKPGGVLVFDTLNRFSMRHWIALPFNLVRNRKGRDLWFARPAQVQQMVEEIGFLVEDKEARYILPTRAYRFLPAPVADVLDAAERWLPNPYRVLTYWKVRKPAS